MSSNYELGDLKQYTKRNWSLSSLSTIALTESSHYYCTDEISRLRRLMRVGETACMATLKEFIVDLFDVDLL